MTGERRHPRRIRRRSRGGLERMLGMAVLAGATAMAAAALPTVVAAQETRKLDEHCTVSILNRSARVRADGSWEIGNVPATGRARVRAVCRFDDGTVGGHSGFIDFQPFQINGFEADFALSDAEPIADGMTISLPTTVLTEIGQTAQLQVTAELPSGGTRDVTSADSGTNYSTSSPNVATVSENGLVTAVMSGTAMISASNEGALAIVRMIVSLSGDSDGDGIADDLEVALGLDPDNAADGLEDFDGDGLTNADEAALGTDIDNGDTDFDGLADGAEVDAGTDPLDSDSDDDGLIDGLETDPTGDEDGDGLINALDPDRDDDGLPDGVEDAISGNPSGAQPNGDNDGDGLSNLDELMRGTDPTDADSDDDGLRDGSEVDGGCDPLVFDAPTIVVGRALDASNDPVAGALVTGYALRLSGRASARSNPDGTFQLPGMTVCGGVQVSGQAFRSGMELSGASVPVDALAGALTDVGDLVLRNQAGDQFALPRYPTTGNTGTSFPLGHLLEGDFNNDGIDDLVAWTLDDLSFSAPAVDALSLFPGRSDGTFGAALATRLFERTKSFGNNRDDIDNVDWDSGDFDGDGNLDLVFTWRFESKATILLGRGDGTFLDPIAIPAIRDAQAVAVGDFDEDGNVDLVITDGNDNTAEIYLGAGDASFVLSSSLTAFDDPEDVVVADLNRDGHTDFVTANNDSDDVSVFLGAGNGTFSTSTPLPVGTKPGMIVVADADGDAVDDLVVLNSESHDVSILTGNGDGTFDAEVRVAIGVALDSNDRLTHVVVAELTGDVLPDLLVASSTTCLFPDFPNCAALLTGTGSGAFAAGLPGLPVTVNLRETRARDLDGDGLLDLLDIANGDVLTAVNLGDGTFLQRPTFGTEDAITAAFAAGDFNGDDVSDIAYINSRTGLEIVIARHNDASPGTFIVEQAIASPPPIAFLAAADFDDDGIVDIAMAGGNNTSSTFWTAKGLGAAAFAAPAQVGQLSARVSELIAVDYDGEGTIDLVGRTSMGFFRMKNLGGGTFAGPNETIPPSLLGRNADWLAVGELDGDGFADFALGGRSGMNAVPDRISVWTSGGDVALSETTIDVAPTGSPRNGVIADFDADGLEDLAVSLTTVIENGIDASGFFEAFAIYPGLGDGTFGDVVLSPLVPEGNRFIGQTDHLLHVDFDGDGNEDLVWTDNGPYIRVLLGHGNGTFGAERRYELGRRQNGDMAIVDIDGDMKPDVAVGRNSGGPAMFLHR